LRVAEKFGETLNKKSSLPCRSVFGKAGKGSDPRVKRT